MNYELGKVGVGISGENLKSAEFGHYDLVFLVLEEDDVYEGRVPRGYYGQ